MEEFQKAYRELNTAQRRAVDRLDGPVLVIAGPGTGKTQLLTTRIANILIRTDSLPQNILCLTFTDSAAQTMRQRLTKIIGKAAYDVTISTYHAFGSELIRRYPEYFNATYDLQPVDELTLDTIYRQVLDKLPYANPLKHDIYLRDIKTLVSDFKRALLTPDALRAGLLENEKFVQEASQLSRQLLSGLIKIDKKSILRFEELLSQLPLAKGGSAVSSLMPLDALCYEQLAEALETVHSSGKTSALTAWKNKWLLKDEHNQFVVIGQQQILKLRAAADIYEDYLEQLKKHQLYDYDDMILQAIQALTSNPELRFSLQERYQYILLDEFQDTNQAQAHLVELLADNPINEDRPNVLAVGDDDQAIYAFQGANYSHMLSFDQKYAQVLVVPLTQNYRSSPDIIELASAISSQIEQRLQHSFPEIDKTMIASGPNMSTAAEIERHQFISDLSQNSWVAKQIKKLIEQGLPAKEIAILAPKHAYLEALVPFLHNQKLPIRYEKSENVLQDQSVIELATMSRLVIALNKGQTGVSDNLWPQVLSFRFWNLPTSLIWDLSWQANENSKSWTDVLMASPRTRQIALFVIHLGLISGNESLEVMLDKLIGVSTVELGEKGTGEYRSPFYDHYFGSLKTERQDSQSFWQLLSNLTVLRQKLRDYRADDLKPLSLNDFLTFIESSQAAGIKILSTNPYQEATDAVELMTVYKAKGKEFQAVFIVAAIDEVWGSKAKSQGYRIALPENLGFIRYDGTTEDERLRLLYVALTRARTKLYITSYSNTFSGKLTTSLKYLNEQTNSKDQIISPLLPTKRQLVMIEQLATPQLADLTLYWQQRHYKAIEQPKLKALLAHRLEHFQLSPTQLNCFCDTSNDGPTTFFIQYLLRFPTAPSISGQYGNAIHETLDWILRYYKEHSKLPLTTMAIAKFSHRLKLKRLSEVDQRQLLDRGKACLKAYLTQRANSIHPADYSEYSFRNEGVFVGQAHLNGKIDRLIIDKKNKKISIVDFKTGRSYSHWTKDIKMHSFQQQLYFYKLLVERSHSFRGYSVDDAYIEFVEPDENGHINELHLKFETQTSKRLEQLIEVVWQHIKELDLPDVSSYSKDIKGIDAFQSDLIEKTAQ
ncbi:MAG TPA: ATP-dependent DNA helicase [Candidatus Dormibacteraeota bacterium]|nr:ATP-dependent DNA helicase [Candidatus Dormibacteraeota bacterium]